MTDSQSSSSSSECNDTGTQYWPTDRKLLEDNGISWDDAMKWTSLYNRRTVPIYREDIFYKIIIDLSKNTDPTSQEFEHKLQDIIQQESETRRKESHGQSCILALYSPFDDARRDYEFTVFLHPDHTIHGTELFIARCLPFLVNSIRGDIPKSFLPEFSQKPEAIEDHTATLKEKSSGPSITSRPGIFDTAGSSGGRGEEIKVKEVNEREENVQALRNGAGRKEARLNGAGSVSRSSKTTRKPQDKNLAAMNTNTTSPSPSHRNTNTTGRDSTRNSMRQSCIRKPASRSPTGIRKPASRSPIRTPQDPTRSSTCRRSPRFRDSDATLE